MSSLATRIVVFTLDDQRYGLALSAVGRVIRMVAVTPLPQAPVIVLGVINMQGKVLPVLDVRQRFRLPARDLALTDQVIIARTARRTVALVTDRVAGLVEYTADQVAAPRDIVPGVEHVEGVVKLGDGMVLIHDLDRFLSLDEEEALDGAIGES
jgi:purine-binding chemotaxis protein CheW